MKTENGITYHETHAEWHAYNNITWQECADCSELGHIASEDECLQRFVDSAEDNLVYDALDCDPRDGEDTYLSFPSFSDGEYTRRGA